MRKDHLYFLTFLAITIIFFIVASISIKHFVIESSDQLIAIQLESTKREADEVAQLINSQLENGIEATIVKTNTQKAIQKTQEMNSFVAVMDWSGKQVCHPDITKVGEKVQSNQKIIEALNQEDSSNQLYEILINQNNSKTGEAQSEIVYLAPVASADLIVTANFNLEKIALQIEKLKKQYYLIFLIMGGLIILTSVLAVRGIGSLYERQLESKNTELETELFNLSKLNTDLIYHQQKIIEEQSDQEEETAQQEEKEDNSEISEEPKDIGKRRILTYIRNEIVPVTLDQIAYIQTENGITYVHTIHGKKSTTNLSLDELYNTVVPPSLFFRANRQHIISITAIEKIVRYGNSQLKILINSASDNEIIISKNKAAEFKQWLSI